MPIPRPIPRPSPNGVPTPPPAPARPRDWRSLTIRSFPWLAVAALLAYTLVGGRLPSPSPEDPAVAAGRAMARALGPVWADSLAEHRRVLRDGKTWAEAVDAKSKMWDSGSREAFAKHVAPILEAIAPSGGNMSDEQKAAYFEASAKLEKGARGL